MPPSPPASSASSSYFNLLCEDDAGELANSLAVLVDGETEAYSTRFPADSVDPSACRGAVEWILKVLAYYRFSPLTAYLTYVNLFLSFHRLQQNGWALQLLSVACLSLAVKMEEALVPTLLDLGRRCKVHLRASYCASHGASRPHCVRLEASCRDSLHLHQLLCSPEIGITSHSPLALAAAAIICAVDETQDLAIVGPTIAASWFAGLTEERISNGYRTMRSVVVERRLRKRRVTSPSERDSGTSSSSSSSLPNKRRKHSGHSCN